MQWESPASGLLELGVINTKEAASYPFQDFCPSRAKEHRRLLSHLYSSSAQQGRQTTPSVTTSGGNNLNRKTHSPSTRYKSKLQTKPIHRSPLLMVWQPALPLPTPLFHINAIIPWCEHPSLLCYIRLYCLPGNKQDASVCFWQQTRCFLWDNHVFSDICRWFLLPVWVEFSVQVFCVLEGHRESVKHSLAGSHISGQGMRVADINCFLAYSKYEFTHIYTHYKRNTHPEFISWPMQFKRHDSFLSHTWGWSQIMSCHVERQMAVVNEKEDIGNHFLRSMEFQANR